MRHPCLFFNLVFSEFHFPDTENVANKMDLKGWLVGSQYRHSGNTISSQDARACGLLCEK